jgi:hypothetical protein
MRSDDTRRFCLPCSAKHGRLVRRVCPSLERSRSASSARSAERAKRQRERERAKARSWPEVLHLYHERWSKLSAWGMKLGHTKLQVRTRRANRCCTGHAYPYGGRITMTVSDNRGDGLATLLHEMAHCAAPPRCAHGKEFREMFLAAAAEVCGRFPKLAPGECTKAADFYAVEAAVHEALADGTIPKLWIEEP